METWQTMPVGRAGAMPADEPSRLRRGSTSGDDLLCPLAATAMLSDCATRGGALGQPHLVEVAGGHVPPPHWLSAAPFRVDGGRAGGFAVVGVLVSPGVVCCGATRRSSTLAILSLKEFSVVGARADVRGVAWRRPQLRRGL